MAFDAPFAVAWRTLDGVDGTAEAGRAVRAVGELVWPGGAEVSIIAGEDGVSPACVARALFKAVAAVAVR